MKIMLALLLTAVLLISLPALALANQGPSSSLTLESMPYPGLTNGEGQEMPDLRFKLYLPIEYDQQPETHFPVLYLLHGSNGSFKDSEWDSFFPLLDRLIAEDKIPPLIAVAPVAGNNYWVDSLKFGPYESAVIQGLVPYIDTNYRTQTQREGRILAGFSMGGYGALRYGLVYPQLFEACILLSPFVQQQEPPTTSRAATGGVFSGEDGQFDLNLWNSKNYPETLVKYGQQEDRVRFFIYATDDDWNHLSEKDDLPDNAWKYNMEVQAVLLYSALNRQNPFRADFPKWEDVPGNPAQLRIVNGGHDSTVWRIGFEEGLAYVFEQ